MIQRTSGMDQENCVGSLSKVAPRASHFTRGFPKEDDRWTLHYQGQPMSGLGYVGQFPTFFEDSTLGTGERLLPVTFLCLDSLVMVR
jgi:hypothetical protein